MTHRAQRMLLKNSTDTATTEPLSMHDLDPSEQHLDVSMVSASIHCGIRD